MRCLAAPQGAFSPLLSPRPQHLHRIPPAEQSKEGSLIFLQLPDALPIELAKQANGIKSEPGAAAGHEAASQPTITGPDVSDFENVLHKLPCAWPRASGAGEGGIDRGLGHPVYAGMACVWLM